MRSDIAVSAAQTVARVNGRLLRRTAQLTRSLVVNDVFIVGAGTTVLIVLFFHDIVFMGRTLTTSSFMWGVMGTLPPFGYPEGHPDYNVYLLDPLASGVGMETMVHKASQVYRDFQLPLWESNIALGRPLLATMTNNVVSPLRAPIILWPSSAMWDAFLLFRFFVAGLFTYLLAKRLGLHPVAGFGSAVAFIFSGFFMLYINMPHPDYAMMIPVFLYALDLMVERATAWRIAAAAAAAALSILADNPESAVLLLAFGGFYYLARGASDAGGITGYAFWRRVPPLIVAMAVGVGLTAFTLLPFIQMTGTLWEKGLTVHRHTPELGLGLQFDSLSRLITLFLPYFNGSPVDGFQNSGWTGIRNYVGVVVAVMAIIGLSNVPAMKKSGLFFAAAAVLVVAKTYGVPLINDLGGLPVIKVIGFGLYLAPIGGFSIAMLAGMGIDRVTREGLWWWQGLAVLLAVVALLGWLVWVNRDLVGSLPDDHLVIQLSFAAVLVVAATAITVAARRLLPTSVAAALIVVLIGAELFAFTTPTKAEFSFIAKSVYATDDLPFVERPARYDPYTKPPYVEFLEQDDSKYRVFGTGYVLYPNSSRVYKIDDVRGFTAATIQRYFGYIREFINPTVRSRFTGAPLPPLGSEQARSRVADNPMFDLLNVKYVLTPNGLPEAYDSDLTERFLAATDGRDSAVRRDVFTIDGQDHLVLFQHPPSSISLTFTPTEETRYLLFRLAMDPDVWQGEIGDGVRFKVTVHRDDTEEVLYSQAIDPKNDPADRHWIDGSADLGEYLGEPARLVLSTLPRKSAAFDWAGWGALRLAPSPDAPPEETKRNQFELVYDDEIQIYENGHVLPRAFVVHEVLGADSQQEAVSMMRRPDFDPSRQAVLEGALPESNLAELDGAGGDAKVSFVNYGDNEVDLRVYNETPGMLVLSDTYYPGWKAYVNGEETPIYPTDLALRSVFLPAGENEVEFKFSPAVFKLGSSLTLLSFGLVVVFMGWGLRRARARRTDASDAARD